MSKPFIILDRDGTLIVERNYLSDPAQVSLLPGAAKGLKQLMELGFGLVIASNQSGVARGYFDLKRLAEIHRRMADLFAVEGVKFDGIYVCPHLPEENCDCRKPRIGLITSAVAQWGFDPTKGFVIGDKPCDIELGQAVGSRTFLVRTGYGKKHEIEKKIRPDYVVDDIVEAAAIIRNDSAEHRR